MTRPPTVEERIREEIAWIEENLYEPYPGQYGRSYRLLRDALDEMEGTTMDWRPIETAPRDGTIIRVFSPYLLDEDFNPSGSTEAQWVADFGLQGAVWDPCHDTWKAATLTHATHWQPLPAPPAKRRENESREPDESHEVTRR